MSEYLFLLVREQTLNSPSPPCRFPPGCGLGEHVRTTSPYTFLVATLSIVVGSLPVGMGLYGPWMAMLLGALVLTTLAYVLGRKPMADVESYKTD